MKAKIWAHRGSSAYAPENTLEAFALAAEMNADGIELDVHLTSDKKLAVCHDERIDRTSDGSGRIADLTLTEIQRFSFNAGFGETYKNVMLPTLEDVYKLIAPSALTVNVELKATGDEFLKLVHEC